MSKLDGAGEEIRASIPKLPGDQESVEIPLEVRVRWEIWNSFVSLLRSYAAAAGPDYEVHSFSDWAKVTYKDRAARFCFSAATGEAVWRTVRPEMESWGDFKMNEDGAFGFPEGAEPMDMAVIHWIAWLGRDELFHFSAVDSLQSVANPEIPL